MDHGCEIGLVALLMRNMALHSNLAIDKAVLDLSQLGKTDLINPKTLQTSWMYCCIDITRFTNLTSADMPKWKHE